MIKKMLSITLIGFLSGILIPISVQAIDESYDIYGGKNDTSFVQSANEPVQVYPPLSSSTKAQNTKGPLGIYEDWTSPTIRSDRWIVRTDQAYEARREVLGHHLLMRYRLEGGTGSNTGFRGAMQRIIALKTTINQIEANFQIEDYIVIGCEENQAQPGTRVRPVMISLSRFNDGTGTPSPTDMTGDHFVRVIVNREAFTSDPEGVLTVQAFLFRCIDAVCSNAFSNVFNLNFGKVRVGEPFSLRAIWEKSNHRFLVGFNNNPDIILAYDPALDKGPARSPYSDIRQQLVNATCMEEPTVTDTEIKVRKVFTNESAIIP